MLSAGISVDALKPLLGIAVICRHCVFLALPASSTRALALALACCQSPDTWLFCVHVSRALVHLFHLTLLNRSKLSFLFVQAFGDGALKGACPIIKDEATAVSSAAPLRPVTVGNLVLLGQDT